MSASFARLCAIVSPPSEPSESGRAEGFAEVESRLAIGLPEDYKRFIAAFGTGCWLEFVWVLNPFSANTFLNLFDQTARQLDAEREIRSKWPEEVPFALYPETGGLLPWGLTDNGDRLYWLTEGEPDSWSTIVYQSRGPRFDRHDLTCCDLLVGWAKGRVRSSVFPDDFGVVTSNPFQPWRPA